MKSKYPAKKNKNVWEYLYSLDKGLKEKRDQIHLEKKLQDEENSLKECTFKPEIKIPDSIMSEITYKQEGSIYERSLQWKQKIDDKYSVLNYIE